MTRKEYVKGLIDSGLDDQEIVNRIIDGDIEKGVKPMSGKTDKEKETFAKLVLKRIRKG